MFCTSVTVGKSIALVADSNTRTPSAVVVREPIIAFDVAFSVIDAGC